jgi:lambda repressor-like predicted transcriptional regulator
MKSKAFKTKEDLTTHLGKQGLTLKKISTESGFSAKNLDSVLSGIMTSSRIRELLDEVIATENLFEQLFDMPISDIRDAWRNKGQTRSMKNFTKKYGVVSEDPGSGVR